jgi:plastocyanin
MLFSRSVVVSALVGLGVATTHAGEMMGMNMNATGAAGLAASETKASGAMGAEASATMASSAMAGMASASASAGAGGMMASGGMVATHVVQVGGANGSLTFSPENVKANVGDLVQFQFHPKVCYSHPLLLHVI